MERLALRVKTKGGQQLMESLTTDNTIGDLKQELSKIAKIPVSRLHVLTGFPPKVFDISNDEAFLSRSALKSGDTLILEERTPEMILDSENEPNAPTESRRHVSDNQGFPGILLKHIVPADNSCLFSSIFFVLNGRVDETGTIVPLMRQIIAETISRETEQFSEAMLGKPNGEYCKWIQNDKSWGGAIEVSILSNYYGMEIAVVDTINGIINRFGEDQQYPHRVFLLFDGIHYDPLYLEPLEVYNILFT